MKKRFSLAIFSVIFVVATLCSIMFVTTASAEVDPTPLATFELGANGSASHADGSSKTSYSETANGYTLSITGGTNMYTGARDAKGNSCIKFGASSKAGSCTIVVPEEVVQIKVYVAAYKAKTATVKVGSTTKALTTKSDNGEYDVITVDTTSTKNVSFSVTSGYRCMLNTIVFYGELQEGDCAHDYEEEITNDATCTTEGVKTLTCKLCGDVTTEAIKAKGHDYEEEITRDATCTDPGVKTLTCKLCGDVKTEDIKAKGHDMELIDKIDSTCTVAGQEFYECAACGASEVKDKPLAPHNVVDGRCSVCGDKAPYVITFGENGEAGKENSTAISANKDFTEGGFTIHMSEANKVYDKCTDAKGNSCLKLGTGSVAGSFVITVPDDVESVVLHVAKYKANAATITVNGMSYTLTKSANDGLYDEIVVDTTETQTINFAVTSGFRCMIDAIDFYVAEPEEPAPEEPITSAIIKGASITAGADLTFNYNVLIPEDHNVEDYEMIICMNEKVYTIYGEMKDGVVVFSFKNIGPQSICDLIDADLLYNGESVAVIEGYSIKQYAADFVKAYGEDPAYAGYIAILGDILAYGEAAYEFVTGEDAGDNFYVDGLKVSDKAPVDGAGASLSKTEGDVKFTAAGVEYYVSNKIYVKFAAAEGVVLNVIKGDEVVATIDVSDKNIFYTDEIMACDFDEIFTFQLVKGEEVIQTLTYSINSYAYAMYKADGSVRSNLALALYRYGASANAFLED